MLAAVFLLCAVADGPIGESCIGCHPAIVARYRTSAMANAMGPVEPRELESLLPVRAGETGFEYRFEIPTTASLPATARPAQILESWRDPRAEKKPAVEVASAPLLFSIGAGRRDRSFAARQGELMWFAPLETMRDAQTGAFHARLAPGQEIEPGLRFDTPIAPECVRCHTDAPPPGDYPGNVAPPAAFVAHGIGCNTCHAHSAEHAAWQARAAASETHAADAHTGPDPLPPAEPDDPVASVSTCARCHLQGDAHIALDDPWRGIPAPAQDLCATCAVFIAAKPTDEIGFVGQVQRMVMSRCFTASLAKFDATAHEAHPARAMTCTTCHDPHAGGYDAAGEHHARGGCMLCHPSGSEHVEGRASPCSRTTSAKESAGADCVTCHMRATGTFDLAEVVIHDHRIVRVPAAPSPSAPLRAKETRDGELAPFTWPGRPKPAWIDDPGLFAMAYAALGDDERALQFAEREPGKTASRMPTYFHTRGSLLERAGKNEAAIAAYDRAISIDPSQGETSVNLGALLGRTGDTKRALEVLSAEIARHPKAEGALRNRAIVRWKMKDRAGEDSAAGAADLDAAFQIRPQAAVARSLAQFWKMRGALTVAQQWATRADELDPRVPARR